jgi:hypothetical protein
MTRFVGGAVRKAASRLAALINRADQDNDTIEAITQMVRDQERVIAGQMGSIATQAATGTLSGAQDAAAQAVADTDPLADIVRFWNTRHDEDVRRTHRKAQGQTQAIGSPFVVGGALLRFPGDPYGPPAEVFRCRCRAIYRARRTGRFVAVPVGETAAAPH